MIILYRNQKDLLLIWIKNMIIESVMQFVNQQPICGSTYEAFEKNGIDVKLANPMKTKAIAEARVKTDKLDARTLAHLLRSNLIAESYIAPDKVRERG
jgi:hypothetical protein